MGKKLNLTYVYINLLCSLVESVRYLKIDYVGEFPKLTLIHSIIVILILKQESTWFILFINYSFPFKFINL